MAGTGHCEFLPGLGHNVKRREDCPIMLSIPARESSIRPLRAGDHRHRRVRIAALTVRSAKASAAFRGMSPVFWLSSRTSRVLARMRSSTYSNAAWQVAPRYSMAPQITPPALAMKSGTTRTPRRCSARSASGVQGILAPCGISLAFKRPALSAFTTSGRAAGI